MIPYDKFILVHNVKSVRIWSYSGPNFPKFGLNTERYENDNFHAVAMSYGCDLFFHYHFHFHYYYFDFKTRNCSFSTFCFLPVKSSASGSCCFTSKSVSHVFITQSAFKKSYCYGARILKIFWIEKLICNMKMQLSESDLCKCVF